jgi:phosphopantothenoylcysteine decarboxylase/phosphopantothenate--cysteine ligase
MWEHPAVQHNLDVLRARGVAVVPPEAGRLAGGDQGLGRLADPDVIVAAVERVLAPKDLDGVRVLVTAGGTREAIDPVRVITNRSSGKQGYAIAHEAHARGAKVKLVTTVDLGASKPAGQVLVGFAAETDDVLANARSKLERKRLDLIVANDVSAPGVGFEHDTNRVQILSPAGLVHDGALSDKRAVAGAVLDAVVAARSDTQTA